MSIAAIHLHGYNVEDYRNSSGQIDQAFKNAGIDSRVLVYHADNVREAREMNADTAHRLSTLIHYFQERGHTVIVTAHSNGNTVMRLCYDLYQTSPDIAVCIQPALPSAMNPAPDAKHVAVYWNPEDRVVKLGKFLTWITGLFSSKWVAERNWGQMGATGYVGSDKNVDNINTLDAHHPRRAGGHSGIFDQRVAGYWMSLITKDAFERAAQL